LLESQRKNKSLETQVDQERQKNKKIIDDFDQMTSMIGQGDADKKAIQDG
jgi:hypothetical protein